MLWFIYFLPKLPNSRKNVEKSDATHGVNIVGSTNDFNMIMGKKFEKFKTYIISDFTESVKHIIQTEIHGILKGYKDHLEKVTSPVEIFSNMYETWGVRIQFWRIRWKCIVKNLIHVVMKVNSIVEVSALEWKILRKVRMRFQK